MATEPETGVGSPPKPGATRPARWRDPRVWLVVLVASFFVVSVYAGAVSYYDLDTRNSTDLGIWMQALSSTATGHPAPFYESYDCLVKERCSFLLVHPAFTFYSVVPIYGAFPSAVTLFAIQSAGVALAAVPLYWLTRQVTGSGGKSLLAGGLYLAWAPTLGGEAFSFHAECFFPLFLFTLAALWQAGRYRWGALVALAAFLSFEVLPVFVFFVGLFFLLPYLERVGRTALQGLRSWRARRAPPIAGLRSTVGTAAAGAREPPVRATLLLMLSALIAYPLLYLFMNVWGAHVLGVPAPPLATGISGLLFNNSSPPAQAPGTVLASSQFVYTTEFWLVLYALVGFLPLLAPRTLVMAVPWIGWTYLTDTTRYVEIGSQYTLIAAAPIFIGLAYAMTRVPLFAPAAAPAAVVGPASPDRPAWRRSPGARRAARALCVAVVAVVVGANLLLMPVNPVLQDAGVTLPVPFQAGYQNHSLAMVPGYAATEQLLGNVPRDASITAAAQLFPLVANYPHAYVLLQRSSPQNLPIFPPYNLSGGFDYALVYPTVLPHLGANFSANLSNPALYGMRGYVGTSSVGPVLLYQLGYSGTATLYGPALPPVVEEYRAGAGLQPAKFAEVAENDTVPGGPAPVVQSIPDANRTGLVFSTAPPCFLLPGSYEIQALVALIGTNLSGIHRSSLFEIKVQGFGAMLVNDSVASTPALLAGDWVDLAWNVTLTSPLPEVAVEGSLLYPHVGLAVASVSIDPTDES